MRIKWRLMLKDIALFPWRVTKFVVGMTGGFMLAVALSLVAPFAIDFMDRYTTVDDAKDYYDSVSGGALDAIVEWSIPGGADDGFDGGGPE